MRLENELKNSFKPLILKLSNKEILTKDEMRDAFEIIMSGQAGDAQIGAFLMGLKLRGETVEEISAAAQYMRDRMTKVEWNSSDGVVMDIVGTGGDGSHSYNISSCAALVVASCGITVAKHGNRAISSNCGAADVLSALGVKTDLSPHGVRHCLERAGIGFMFAPMHHSSMRHVGQARADLGMRTLFNLLGPLANPACATHYLLGVFAREWVEPIAHVLHDLGAKGAMVVHGAGTDEITTTGTTWVAHLHNGDVTTFAITPQSLGLAIAKIEDIRGGDASYNAAALRGVLEGKPSAYRDMVVMNSAAALLIAEKASTLKEGADMAQEAIDRGKAADTLDRLIKASNDV